MVEEGFRFGTVDKASLPWCLYIYSAYSTSPSQSVTIPRVIELVFLFTTLGYVQINNFHA